MIAFERNDAVWLANIDGTGEKKIADGIFPEISPDGTRIAFNTVEKTSGTSYVRHMAVVDVAIGKVTIFKDVPSDNSYYPSWTADGRQILFTTRPKQVWDVVAINADGTKSQKATRLTPKKLFGWDGVWIDNDNILFLSKAVGEKEHSIYRISVDGKNVKRVIKNARFPSFSAP